jgi:hypothetical protein
MLPYIHHSFDNAIAIACQHFESLGGPVQAESLRDHKSGLDPALLDQVNYGLDVLILATDDDKGESFAHGIVHREGALISPYENMEDVPHQPLVIGQAIAQRHGERKNPLTDRHTWKNPVNEMSRGVRHPPPAT